MFILMGVLATASGMSQELFRAGHAWLGRFRGGLALATIGACGGFAAICGSSVATAATMSNIALPEMRRFGYPRRARDRRDRRRRHARHPDPALGRARGLCLHHRAGRRPPVHRRHRAGRCSRSRCTWRPCGSPTAAACRAGEAIGWRERLAALRGVWAVLLLFVAIIGGIYLGVVTPTEAAAAGAFLTCADRRGAPPARPRADHGLPGRCAAHLGRDLHDPDRRAACSAISSRSPRRRRRSRPSWSRSSSAATARSR